MKITKANEYNLILGRKGLGQNNFGPGNLECDPYKGWHVGPYEPKIHFYDPSDSPQKLIKRFSLTVSGS
jgi:hypothetical protein